MAELKLIRKLPGSVRVVKPEAKVTRRRNTRKELNAQWIKRHEKEFRVRYVPLIENYTWSASCVCCKREFIGEGRNRGQLTAVLNRHCTACNVDPEMKVRFRGEARARAQRKVRDERLAFVNLWKEQQGCYVCGEQCCYMIDLHHINPDEKEFGVAELIMCSWERLKAELLKCVCLCRNHHALVSQNRLSLLFNCHNGKSSFVYTHGMEPGYSGEGKVSVEQGYPPVQFFVRPPHTHSPPTSHTPLHISCHSHIDNALSY